ncbi:MAG: PepSY-associated TM helix domain-containing protein [Steroidobacteraceae bacterium]
MLRRMIYQVHLWIGIALGLYVLMMSVTGSAIVARRELIPLLVPQSVAVAGERLDHDQLERAARKANPDSRVLDIHEDLRPARRPGNGYGRGPIDPSLARPVQVTLERDGEATTRLFNPFTGEDLGDEQPWALKLLVWTTDLHADLLGGTTGRTINGYLGLAFTVLLLSGLVTWTMRGRRHFFIRRHIDWRRQTLQLHSSFGFWPFLLLLLWAVSGLYLTFPTPFNAVLEGFFPAVDGFSERADQITAWLATAHFGRFGGLGIRWTWIVLGLVPAALFVSGLILWSISVVKPWLRRQSLRRQA